MLPKFNQDPNFSVVKPVTLTGWPTNGCSLTIDLPVAGTYVGSMGKLQGYTVLQCLLLI